MALVVYMLLAAILTFGQILFCSQGIQQAADLAARELSRTPLPADDTFTMALADTGVQSRIYDERYLVLVIDPGSDPVTFNGGHPIGDFPLVNQQLLPLMIYEPYGMGVVSQGGTTMTQVCGPCLRYPGAVFKDPNAGTTTLSPSASGLLVRIPVVSTTPYPPPAIQTIVNWFSVLEEIPSTANSTSAGTSTFSVSSSQGGVVELRVNYPYQSATMSGYQTPADPTTAPVRRTIPSAPSRPATASQSSSSPQASAIPSSRSCRPASRAARLRECMVWGRRLPGARPCGRTAA